MLRAREDRVEACGRTFDVNLGEVLRLDEQRQVEDLTPNEAAVVLFNPMARFGAVLTEALLPRGSVRDPSRLARGIVSRPLLVRYLDIIDPTAAAQITALDERPVAVVVDKGIVLVREVPTPQRGSHE